MADGGIQKPAKNLPYKHGVAANAQTDKDRCCGPWRLA